ncbi:MAG: putative long chain acyl-CoA synthase [Bradymonadia bacterium]|jgi:putative long chain acyl-CoA synthase
MPTPKRPRGRFSRLTLAANNALSLLRNERLGEPYRAPFNVVRTTPTHTLRRYNLPDAPPSQGRPLLLVPPLMVTSEVYDIAADLSAVAWLNRRGVDVWLVDFGAPETESGGMTRTLDDHVLAVDEAIDAISEETGGDVHLGGYSQGGMFVYQVAAFRESRGIASVITFGSPVDIHRSIPALPDVVAERLIRALRVGVDRPLRSVTGLPGALTSTGFKLLSVRKELQQFVELFAILHDRDALQRRESRRRFLGGEGFVAWPGPAFRTFVDQFIVQNRMVEGGFVIDGKTATLDQISCPILYFVGTRDEIARPASVRAIRDAVTASPPYEVAVRSGHFGLVVGSTALGLTWPTVRSWMLWQDGLGEQPPMLRETVMEPDIVEDEADAFENADVDIDSLLDVSQLIDDVVSRIGSVARHAAHWADAVRWQLPRLARIGRLRDDERVGLGVALRKQALRRPTDTFFLWNGRAFSYAAADARVDAVVKGLWHCGVRPGERVALAMRNRPTYLSAMAALNRIGAVVCIVPEGLEAAEAMRLLRAERVLADPVHAHRFVECTEPGSLLMLGAAGDERLPVAHAVDMEAIDVRTIQIPVSDDSGVGIDGGLASDLAMLVVTEDAFGDLRAARITNRRWALGALGAAAACQLTPNDTVYCCLPLSEPVGGMLAVGGAIVSGARLALSREFTPGSFWAEVRQYGASHAFYVGDMFAGLLAPPAKGTDHVHPLRIICGSGMPADTWSAMVSRFALSRVVAVHTSSEANFALVNLSGEKVGSVGSPLAGSGELALVRCKAGELMRDADGRLVLVGVGESGLLIAKVGDGAFSRFEGYADLEATARVLLENPFGERETWLLTQTICERDADGDFRVVRHQALQPWVS